ncbi:cobyrinate a,c-diamide synthase [Domibacillus epiphyticus]|uniref:Cobyrinate a,c-diamide synthase n=1 Tax=Domibacillus epiphyticus TaxID=1714355 RepID=A0A1V2A733_9BACI|nr:cobyrinate a,c-diamide synthase [Domibacillus epiphyticus]OMP66740.1 cobyrinic acid a,c-diamide synthase [Domibacillus epiphyticus]
MTKRIVIAGTGSGSGKTTVTLALLGALMRRNLSVQPFKCGPDYIDPTYHTAICGRLSRSLDSWMGDADTMTAIFKRASFDADISVIEGVMGMFDGKNPLLDDGSTADISRILDAPVLLVIDASGTARSAAAIVKGFQSMAPGRIKGVIANKTGSASHFKIIEQAVMQECGIPVIGHLNKMPGVTMPERHLGLVPAVERGDLNDLFDTLADAAEKTIDIEQLLAIAQTTDLPPVQSALFESEHGQPVTIAVAKDSAFHFYYEENIEILRSLGANIHYFSPLAGELIPDDADALYIGGGFPEEFAPLLAAQCEARKSIKRAVESGMPTLAECGGFMFLTDELMTVDNHVYPMCGIIPGRTIMKTTRAALGYREMTALTGAWLPDGLTVKGHEFHYSVFEPSSTVVPAYQSAGRFGAKPDGCIRYNAVTGYAHIYFPSNKDFAAAFVSAARAFTRKEVTI